MHRDEFYGGVANNNIAFIKNQLQQKHQPKAKLLLSLLFSSILLTLRNLFYLIKKNIKHTEILANCIKRLTNPVAYNPIVLIILGELSEFEKRIFSAKKAQNIVFFLYSAQKFDSQEAHLLFLRYNFILLLAA